MDVSRIRSGQIRRVREDQVEETKPLTLILVAMVM